MFRKNFLKRLRTSSGDAWTLSGQYGKFQMILSHNSSSNQAEGFVASRSCTIVTFAYEDKRLRWSRARGYFLSTTCFRSRDDTKIFALPCVWFLRANATEYAKSPSPTTSTFPFNGGKRKVILASEEMKLEGFPRMTTKAFTVSSYLLLSCMFCHRRTLDFFLSPLAATQTRQLYTRKILSNDRNKKMHVLKFYFRFFLVPTMNDSDDLFMCGEPVFNPSNRCQQIAMLQFINPALN